MAMLTRIVVGMFRTSYNSVSGFSSIYLDFANVFNIDNYVPYFIVAIIMGLLMLIGDGGDFDLGLDGLDFGSGSGSSGTRKTRRELEREVINDLKDVDIF
jgi:hypothetical protein